MLQGAVGRFWWIGSGSRQTYVSACLIRKSGDFRYDWPRQFPSPPAAGGLPLARKPPATYTADSPTTRLNTGAFQTGRDDRLHPNLPPPTVRPFPNQVAFLQLAGRPESATREAQRLQRSAADHPHLGMHLDQLIRRAKNRFDGPRHRRAVRTDQRHAVAGGERLDGSRTGRRGDVRAGREAAR